MNRLITYLSLAAICGTALLSAQAPPAAAGQKPDHSVTVTGCVAPGTGTGQFILTNAVTMPAVADKAKPVAEKEKMPPGRTMTYMLVGGTDLKAHVGHKVEVMGMLAKPGVPPSSSAKPDPGASASKDTGGTVTVSSVKMVSATCP